MLRVYVFPFFFSILFFSLPVLSIGNLIHGRECFVTYPWDKSKTVVYPHKTVGIDGPKGKGVKIAIFEKGIDVRVLEGTKNILNPNSVAISSTGNLTKLNLPQLEKNYNDTLIEFEKLPVGEQRRSFANYQEKLKKLSDLIVRKRYCNKINNYTADDIIKHPELVHGTNVVSDISRWAPESELHLVDINLVNNIYPGEDPWKKAFEIIIKGEPDVVNMTCWPQEHNPHFVQGLTKLIQKGIPVIVGAGNDSTENKPMFVNQERLPNGTIRKSEIYSVYENSKNRELFLFVGALGYKIDQEKKGEEKYSKFSQHPTKESLKNYIVAPGENFITLEPHKSLEGYRPLRSGTSFSAPLATGVFARLLSYVRMKDLECSPPALLRTIYDSGHDLKHNISGVPIDSYKVLDLQSAYSLADKILKKRAPQTVKPQVPVNTPNVKKSPQNVVPNKAPLPTKKVIPIQAKKPSPTVKGKSKSPRPKKKVISKQKSRASKKKDVKKRQLVRKKRTR